jgi:hypothetical protein
MFYKLRPHVSVLRCQKGDMKHAPFWRLTHIKHHHKKFSCPNELVLGICLPLSTVNTGTVLALERCQEGKYVQNGSIWMGWVLIEHIAWNRDMLEKLIVP